MNLMEIYRSINDFSSGPHRILCPLQVHTTQQIKKKFWLSTGCDKKKNCSTGPCAIITNTYCCKKINSPVQKQGYTNQLVSIYILFSFLFFFFVDLWSFFFFYFKNFILCLMNVLISCCTFVGRCVLSIVCLHNIVYSSISAV